MILFTWSGSPIMDVTMLGSHDQPRRANYLIDRFYMQDTTNNNKNNEMLALEASA